MKLVVTTLAVIVSIGSAIAIRAEVTNISTQQTVKVVGNNITTIDSRTTMIKNGKVLKPRSTVSGLKKVK